MMEIKLLSHQYDFINADEKFCLLLGGLGSGKSYAGRVFVLDDSITDPSPLGLITANTYNQLQNVVLEPLFAELDLAGCYWDYNQNKKLLTVENSKWLTFSTDNFNMLRGIELGRFWSDETRDMPEAAFLVLLGRLRDKKAKRLKGRFTSTPNGYNYLYDYFVGEKSSSQFRLIKAQTASNYHLPDGYLDTIKANYDEKMFLQEAMAEFISVAQGQVYYAFNRKEHVKKLEIKPNQGLWCGMDFNINPMTCTIAQIYDNSIFIIDEFYVEGSNTDEIGEMILKKYGNHVAIVPDASGKALKTSGYGLSDHEILRRKGFRVIYNNNPFRVDRYNCVNNLLAKQRLFINETCKQTIRDFERVVYKEGSNFPDDSDPKLTHLSDGVGYLSWYAFPLLQPKGAVGTVQRYL